jgi:hypothetical protein
MQLVLSHPLVNLSPARCKMSFERVCAQTRISNVGGYSTLCYRSLPFSHPLSSESSRFASTLVVGLRFHDRSA